MSGCQNYDPFLGTLNTRCRMIIGIQKGTIILITTHVELGFRSWATQGLGLKVFGNNVSFFLGSGSGFHISGFGAARVRGSCLPA